MRHHDPPHPGIEELGDGGDGIGRHAGDRRDAELLGERAGELEILAIERAVLAVEIDEIEAERPEHLEDRGCRKGEMDPFDRGPGRQCPFDGVPLWHEHLPFEDGPGDRARDRSSALTRSATASGGRPCLPWLLTVVATPSSIAIECQ
jgi:hypothetical protein